MTFDESLAMFDDALESLRQSAKNLNNVAIGTVKAQCNTELLDACKVVLETWNSPRKGEGADDAFDKLKDLIKKIDPSYQ